MGDEGDDWIKNRILWVAGKYGVPNGETRFFDGIVDPPKNVSRNLSKVGWPVVLSMIDADHWTLLGTKGVRACVDGEVIDVDLSSITRVSWSADEPCRPKRERDRLVLQLADSSLVQLRVPAGNSFFFMFNVLLRLAGGCH